MTHAFAHLGPESMILFVDEGDDHAVEVEKEHDQVKAQFEEGFL